MLVPDGKIYTSCIDAAEAIGVTGGAISRHVTGITHTCTGKKFCFAKDIAEHLGEISDSMQHRQKMYDSVVEKSAQTYAENAELHAENDRLRKELNALREEFSAYKEREQKRKRIKELEAEIEKLKEEL